MPKYFSKFPKLYYTTTDGVTRIVTNLLTRPDVIKKVIDNASIFYYYDVQEGDTPEMIASKYYGDPELHWVVLLFNEIYDPYYDWPMSYQQFIRYLDDKYTKISLSQDAPLTGNLLFSNNSNVVIGTGTQFTTQLSNNSQLFYFNTVENSNVYNMILTVKSVESDTHLTLTSNSTYTTNTQIYNETVMTGIHHFEKVIEKIDSFTGTTTTNIYEIDMNTYLRMQDEPLIEVKSFDSGHVVTVTTFKRYISNYEYETQKNDNNRKIKLVKKELVADIVKQFDTIMSM